MFLIIWFSKQKKEHAVSKIIEENYNLDDSILSAILYVT